jgi:hypothetical protein
MPKMRKINPATPSTVCTQGEVQKRVSLKRAPFLTAADLTLQVTVHLWELGSCFGSKGIVQGYLREFLGGSLRISFSP